MLKHGVCYGQSIALAQKSNNKAAHSFRSGRPFLLPRRTMECLGGIPSRTPPSSSKKARYSFVCAYALNSSLVGALLSVTCSGTEATLLFPREISNTAALSRGLMSILSAVLTFRPLYGSSSRNTRILHFP